KILGKVEISKAISIIRQKYLLVRHIFLHRQQPLSYVRPDAGIGERDLPIMDIAVGKFQALAAFGENEVVRQTFIVIKKVLLDQVTAIPEAKNEFITPKMSKIFHHVPEDRTVSDWHHGLWNLVGIVAQP